jgi:hypothetical protein
VFWFLKSEEQRQNHRHRLAVKETVEQMNSSRPNPVEQPLTNFLEVCRRRFPSATVNGSGRWAVCSFCAGKPQAVTVLVNLITLVADRETAEQLYCGPCGRPHCCRVHELNDLMPTPTATRTIPDAYDPDELRRERRERREAQAQGTSVA